MGDYDHRKFRQVILDADTYKRLQSMKLPGETFSDVVRKLIGEGGGTLSKKGRPREELSALAKVANLRWQRKVASGRIRIDASAK